MLADFLLGMSTFEALVIFWLASIFWMLLVIGRILEKSLAQPKAVQKQSVAEPSQVEPNTP